MAPPPLVFVITKLLSVPSFAPVSVIAPAACPSPAVLNVNAKPFKSKARTSPGLSTVPASASASSL